MAQVTEFDRSVRLSKNLEPAIPRLEQDKTALAALADLRQKQGRRPNILWLVLDDMGYGDPGCYGGGASIGAATPNMNRLARGGINLTH